MVIKVIDSQLNKEIVTSYTINFDREDNIGWKSIIDSNQNTKVWEQISDKFVRGV